MCASNIPEAKIYIFYIDMRAPGQRYEKFYQKIKEDPNIFFIKGKVAEVGRRRRRKLSPWRLKMRLPGKRSSQTVDMVVLATGHAAHGWPSRSFPRT